MLKCPNCGQDANNGHYVPPSMGDEGFWACESLNKHAAKVRYCTLDEWMAPLAETHPARIEIARLRALGSNPPTSDRGGSDLVEALLAIRENGDAAQLRAGLAQAIKALSSPTNYSVQRRVVSACEGCPHRHACIDKGCAVDGHDIHQPCTARVGEVSPARECAKTCTDTECTVYSACKRHGGSTLRPSQPGFSDSKGGNHGS